MNMPMTEQMTGVDKSSVNLTLIKRIERITMIFVIVISHHGNPQSTQPITGPSCS